MGLVKLIFDTDGGIDDCAALWWALTDPRIDLLAVTTTAGAVAEDVAAVSVLKVLAAAGRPDVPVAVGRPGQVGPTPFLEPWTLSTGTTGKATAGTRPRRPHPSKNRPSTCCAASSTNGPARSRSSPRHH
jgi:inosine-uridine nucleoside N-ribohydrolase